MNLLLFFAVHNMAEGITQLVIFLHTDIFEYLCLLINEQHGIQGTRPRKCR